MRDLSEMLPEKMTPQMEAIWREAFIHQGYNRRGGGAAGNARRLKHPESCEQKAWQALRKYLLNVASQ